MSATLAGCVAAEFNALAKSSHAAGWSPSAAFANARLLRALKSCVHSLIYTYILHALKSCVHSLIAALAAARAVAGLPSLRYVAAAFE